MILTGKAKEDFEKWVFDTQQLSQKFGDLEDVHDWIFYLPQSCFKALIIEWFDSVCMVISIRWEWSTKTFQTSIFSNNNTSDVIHLPHHDERQKATEQAIIKANEIYNQRNTNCKELNINPNENTI